MWWVTETIRIGKQTFDIWVQKGGLRSFGFAVTERKADESGKLKRVKPEKVAYDTMEKAFADLYRLATAEGEQVCQTENV